MKYHNTKTVVGGIEYDSRKEACRGEELRLMERAGIISGLKRQGKYELIPPQKLNGRGVERAVNYVADFEYTKDGETIVEDVKSPATITKEYIIKRKLMLWEFGIRIIEV